MEEEVLQGSIHREVVRVGNTVRRPVHPWSASVHALLNHLESVGFPYSPRILGIDEQGREILSFIHGDHGADGWWKVHGDDGLEAFAHLLREYHAAVADFRPGSLAWSTGTVGLGDHEIICHGDFGPWNVIWQGFKPVGLIDWDYARPARSTFDVAYTLEYVTPFRNDQLANAWMHFPNVPNRGERLRKFVRAYGGDDSVDWAAEVVDVQRQGLDLVRSLAKDGAEPQATWARDGYLNDLADQLRWSEEHHHLFE